MSSAFGHHSCVGPDAFFSNEKEWVWLAILLYLTISSPSDRLAHTVLSPTGVVIGATGLIILSVVVFAIVIGTAIQVVATKKKKKRFQRYNY